MDQLLYSTNNDPPVRRILRFGSLIPERTPMMTPMHSHGRICKFKRKKHKVPCVTLEWHIPEFFTCSQNVPTAGCICSPAFNFLDYLFRLSFYLRDGDTFSFNVMSGQELDNQIGFTLGFGKTDGTVENPVSGIIKINGTCSRESCDIKFVELRQRRSEFIPDDILIVKCSLRKDTPVSEMDKSKPPKLIKLEALSDNFRQLFGDEDTCDTTVKVSGKEYKVHRLVLIARCKVFAALFKHDTLEKRTGIIVINDCEPESFKKFLEYLYCGKIDEVSFRNALSLYQIADKYGIEELREFCVEYLIQFLTVENFCDILLFADKFAVTTLISSLQDFFNLNVNDILVTAEWKSLMETNYNLAIEFLLKMPKVDHRSDLF